MRLSQLIASIENVKPAGSGDPDITGIALDSRKVAPGFLFIATPGTAQDGRQFIADAVQRGAAAVVVPDDEMRSGVTPHLTSPSRGEEHRRSDGRNISQNPTGSPPLEGGVGGGVTQEPNPPITLTTPHIRAATSALAAAFYPRQPEIIAAVTGTSGKTSTAQFTREIWQTLGHASASIGTLGLVTAAGTEYGSLTTPDAVSLHQTLDRCAGDGVTHLAVEASSHGLILNRLDKVRLKAGGFTNLSRDHLDYHKTMEDYLNAKLRLFNELLPRGAASVLNADIAEYDALRSVSETRGLQILSYGGKGQDLTLRGIRPDTKGQNLQLTVLGKDYEILLPVIGGFQAYNALCALGLVIGSGGDAGKAVAALGKLTGVPGRLQLAGYTSTGGAVFIDYAHKPDALENVLTALRPHVAAHSGAKLGVVFGCGGNRDKGKRPLMGDIARRLADWVIVTDDNPRHENPAAIRAEIMAGAASPAFAEIPDRAAAIRQGVERLNKGDVLIVAGKGHEPGQIIGDEVLPFDDLAVAREIIGYK